MKLGFDNQDFLTSVALGAVPGNSIMNALGERETMGTTATGEDISRMNELSPAPTSTTSIPIPSSSGEQMTFVSEDAADNGTTATGVLTLRMHYIEATNGTEQTEDITMNGTTAVDTVATNIMFVNDIYTLTVGSNGVAEGHIKVYKKGTAGLVYNMIAAGGNKSLIPNRMVPSGKKLILKGWHCSEAKGKRVAFRIRSTDMNGTLIPGVFCFKDVEYINKESTGELTLNVCVPALSIVKVSGWPDTSDAEGSCGWWGLLKDA